MSVMATHDVKPMRGSAQSHLMLASDRHLYVVKFQNNPQHPRVLANEILATALARHIGLPVPSTEVVEVTADLIQISPTLRIELAHEKVPCQAGLQFGSRYVGEEMGPVVFDLLPASALREVLNLSDFAGALVLDKWTSNSDHRQAVFWRGVKDRTCRAVFIDQGHCFSGGKWAFCDAPTIGIYHAPAVYHSVLGLESFEPWLSNAEYTSESFLRACVRTLPWEWYGHNVRELDMLLEELFARRRRIPDLIRRTCREKSELFPNCRRARQIGYTSRYFWSPLQGASASVEANCSSPAKEISRIPRQPRTAPALRRKP